VLTVDGLRAQRRRPAREPAPVESLAA
jgi:hypothetical protein